MCPVFNPQEIINQLRDLTETNLLQWERKIDVYMCSHSGYEYAIDCPGGDTTRAALHITQGKDKGAPWTKLDYAICNLEGLIQCIETQVNSMRNAEIVTQVPSHVVQESIVRDALKSLIK